MFVLALASMLFARADEGMWLPYLLGQQVYDDMVKKGLKLSKEQLYSINQASIKDAVVMFGSGGCSGVIVSNKGLMFSNHHCGFSVIADASNAEHNYLKDGFYARSLKEEVPSPGLTMRVLIKIEDKTGEIEDSIKGWTERERAVKLDKLLDSTAARSVRGSGYDGRIMPVFKGNQYLLFVFQTYKDVRLVGTPPLNVGEFGAISDDWRWPRHSCDFSIFRIYTGKDGRPAAYSPDNVPLIPRYSLPISIKGVKENDYTMVFGFPGNTDRYASSYAVKLKMEVEDSAMVVLRDLKLKYKYQEILENPAARSRLVPEYSGSANYRKFCEGEIRALRTFNVYSRRQEEEANFERWAAEKPEYAGILKEYAEIYAKWAPCLKERLYIIEGILGARLSSFATGYQRLESVLAAAGTPANVVAQAMKAADKNRREFVNIENRALDVEVLAKTCQLYYERIPAEGRPAGFYEALQSRFGSLNDSTTFHRWAMDLLANTMLLNENKWDSFMVHPDVAVLRADPIFAYDNAFIGNYLRKCGGIEQEFYQKKENLDRRYLKARMIMEPGKIQYPDANNTLRISYGQAKSYSVPGAERYDYECTVSEVLKKYKPGDIEFDLPDKYIDLCKQKEWGIYKDKGHNEVVTGFITTNDITGGNSGSPVLNAKGQLIGLAFDSNYESLDQKLQFQQETNRTLCVDIRYVLWCIDKLGGASNIIDELQVIK